MNLSGWYVFTNYQLNCNWAKFRPFNPFSIPFKRVKEDRAFSSISRYNESWLNIQWKFTTIELNGV